MELEKQIYSGDKEYRFAWFILMPDPENSKRWYTYSAEKKTIKINVNPKNFQ